MPANFGTAIVIGASSGIGEALVRALAAKGTAVVAVARRADALDALAAAHPGKVTALVHDVRRVDEAPEAFARALASVGGHADLVIYNAGVMPRVAPDGTDFEADRHMVEVNLLGAMRWLGLAAEHLQGRGSGTLVGVSSVAGDRGRRQNPGYHATKAALTTYLESLRNRLSQRGVRVVTIKPGPVRTAMTEGLRLPLLISAEEAADGILRACAQGPEVAYVPAIWGPIMATIRAIPSAIFRRTNI
jgi:decaprenylphospho-beta-D-erythro-pentofuranosid-2-ulose 2-reductase